MHALILSRDLLTRAVVRAPSPVLALTQVNEAPRRQQGPAVQLTAVLSSRRGGGTGHRCEAVYQDWYGCQQDAYQRHVQASHLWIINQWIIVHVGCTGNTRISEWPRPTLIYSVANKGMSLDAILAVCSLDPWHFDGKWWARGLGCCIGVAAPSSRQTGSTKGTVLPHSQAHRAALLPIAVWGTVFITTKGYYRQQFKRKEATESRNQSAPTSLLPLWNVLWAGK